MTKAGSIARPDAINSSCRGPMLMLFISGAIWLVVGSAFGLIASIKFHAPAFLADVSWLTYGRVRPAYLNCLLYGFSLQAVLGVTLWLFARLGRAELALGWLAMLGSAAWNLGVTLGVGGILLGDSTGFELLEMPSYAAFLLFIGYLLMGLSATVTLHQREERPLYVAQWFLLAALFWFPWIYSTANLLLVEFPARGVTQAVIDWWYTNNFLAVWLALAGLATGFYLLTKLLNRELHNYYLALFTFWTLVLFTSWAGVPETAPVPAWLPAISTAATALTILPLLAVALNVHNTLQGSYSKLGSNPILLFAGFGVLAFLVAGLMRIFSTFVNFQQQLHFTWFEPAQSLLNSYGFFAMLMFGAIYYILPQVIGLDFPAPKLVRAHFWLAGLGVALYVVPLAVGGLIQAGQMQNPAVAFVDISRSGLTFLRVSTLGDLLMLAGHLILATNVIGIAVRCYQSRAVAVYSDVTADLFKPAEVKS